MKRFASTIFLVIFTASIVGRTVERTTAWTALHVRNFKHSDPSHTGTRIAEVQKQAPRQVATKLVEDGSVLYVPFVRSVNTPRSADAFAHRLTDFVADSNHRTLSSRAPPAILS